MNFDKIDIIQKIKGFKIYSHESGTMEKIKFCLEDIVSPFALETFNKVTYINWEIPDDVVNVILCVEDSLQNEIISRYPTYQTWKWLTTIRGKDNYTKLLRTKSSLLIEKNIKTNITIILDKLWTDDKTKTFGLSWLSE
jgi:hypothetical protein